MAMRPPIDQTLWDAGGMNRGDYDSMFAMRPDGQGPGGPGGMGFGAPPGYPSNMPVIGAQPQQPWDAQPQGGIDPSRIQELARLIMGAGKPQPDAEQMLSRNNFGDMGGPSYSRLDGVGTDYLDAVINGQGR